MAASTGAACGMNIGWPCVSGVRLVQNILTGEAMWFFNLLLDEDLKRRLERLVFNADKDVGVGECPEVC